MKTEDYKKIIIKNKRYKTIISNLNKKLTVAYEIIDELQTDRNKKEEIIRLMDDQSKWTDYL